MHRTRKSPWHFSPASKEAWQAPGTHARTLMKRRCGNKCFLGPAKCNCFPICNPGTCNINKKGVLAAYKRARTLGSRKSKRNSKHTKKQYRQIAVRARKLL